MNMLPSKRRVACAAIKMDDGTVVTGARHYSPDMRRLMERIYGDGYWRHEVEQGFIDNRGEWLTREQAFVLARESGQCPHLPPEGVACLFSEDLY